MTMLHVLTHVLPLLDSLDLGHLTQTCRTLRRQPHAQKLHAPIRLVMMPTTLCTICDRTSSVLCHTRMVHYTSGWQACESCRLTMLYSHFQWMGTISSLSGAHFPSLQAPDTFTVRFYRFSRDRIQEQASVVMSFFEFILWRRGELMVMCYWGDQEGRLVRLSNLIVHNRSFLGYRLPHLVGLPETALQTWSERLRDEYHRANEFDHLLLCLNRRRISLSRDVLQCLFRRWRSLFSR